MQFNSKLRLLGALILLVVGPLRTQAATFGEVIQFSGTPADIVLDESRHRLYLVISTGNRVDVYDYSSKAIINSIAVGERPLGAAMSMDSQFLYVANHDSSTISVIALEGGFGGGTISLPAKPQGLEVGADGRVAICTDGSGTASTANTLLTFDPLQAAGSQVSAVPFPPPPATPPALQQLFATQTASFNCRLRRTPDGAYIVGVSSITNNTSTVVFTYESQSGVVLQSRTVVGQSSTLSMAPDGSSFMAGFTLYDTATLNVLGQQSIANAPFPMTGAFSTTANVGGSVFAPDGKTLYSAFNTAPQTNPPSAAQSATLLISDPRSLAIRLGINLPESLVSRMVMTASGEDAWGLSSSGVLYLPLSTLFNQPILMPEQTTVFLEQDDCYTGVVKVKLRIANIGGGTLTYAVPQQISGGSAALVVTADSGLAPSGVTFTLDPGRSGVVRTVGTNLYTGGGSNNTGTAVNIQLVSATAINVPHTIRVFMNYRDSTMRGVIYPLATVPNSTAAAYEGLWDIALDEARKRVYLSNSGYNRIEVFDYANGKFVDPIPVGQLPHQIAMGLDGSTLYVATTGGESVFIVDLDLQQVVGRIVFPPVPRAGNAAVVSVRGMAAGLRGLQLVMSNGTLWRVVDNQAIPRIGTSVTGITATGAQTAIAGPVQQLLGAPDGASAILLGGTGTAYLYDALTDAYTTSRQLFTNPIIGYYGPLGVSDESGFLLANGLVLNSSLTVIGGAASPGQITVTPPMGPGQIGGVGITSTGLRNVAGVAPVGSKAFVRMTTAVRNNLTAATNDDIHPTLEAVDTRTGVAALAARMPETPVVSIFGTTRTNLPPHQMVVASDGTVFAITVSGLSVVPLAPSTVDNQPAIAATRGVTDSTQPTAALKPGSFISIRGTNLAASATADQLPPPVVLGGSCVLVEGVAIPLLTTGPGEITAQLPATLRSGAHVVEVRSLSMAQRSKPVLVTLQKP